MLEGKELFFIKIWCEYDISGAFGGNNNEDIIVCDARVPESEIEERCLKYIKTTTGLTNADLEGLWGYSFINYIGMAYLDS
tara:strand:- start:225 stop:467 length:243 start_codon:yes stop_codon:yes gene_type:complete